jgi:hypothetical protein
MKLCPIAIVAGCAKCPVRSVCPLKTVIGDAPSQEEKPAAKAAAPVKSAPSRKSTAAGQGSKAARSATTRKKSR